MATKQNLQWWREAIIYQVYVRSFYDSNGDGIGDLRGVEKKLTYLKTLGIGAIWLSPVTVSANADWGYDVTDYKDIDPDLGTLKDFDSLLEAATKQGIKVLIDLVPNHTSSHHPWFLDALTSRDSRYRDYYIWADGKPGKKPPSNWKSYFGGSAWKFHEPTGQYYLHSFLKDQPELNWRNPKVVEEFDSIMKFWLDKGVAGFRIDVFNMIIKDLRMRDNPKATRDDWLELQLLGQRPTYNVSQPEVHGILKRWRKLADSYPQPRLLLGETTLVFDVDKVAEFYGAQDELELAFNFGFTESPFTASKLSTVVEETVHAIHGPDWPVWTNSNHDQSRFPSRWAAGDERKIRCGLMILMCLQGTPVLYYGDEIGMENAYVPRWKMKDPRGTKFWPLDPGRDIARSPMPWKDVPGAGFTTATAPPWLPFGNVERRNVATQDANDNSTLKFTRKLIKLRQSSDDLRVGPYQQLPSPGGVWMWQRGSGHVMVVNMTDEVVEMPNAKGKIILATSGPDHRHDVDALNLLILEPWEGFILHV